MAVLSALLVLVTLASSIVIFENYQKRGELLQVSLVERAKAEGLVRDNGYRQRAIDLLREARLIGESDRIREEAVQIVTGWDIGEASAAPPAEERAPHPAGLVLEISPSGLLMRDDGEDGTAWELRTGVVRCEPALSVDGRFLAVVEGDRMEVALFDIPRRRGHARIAVEGWPDSVAFEGDSDRLRVHFPDGSALLADLDGRVLVRDYPAESEVIPPIGFSRWRGHLLPSSEGIPSAALLSPDEALLATTSVSGVQIWSVADGKAVDFYDASNQSIDAPTDAWWLSPRRLLVQVPGAQEIVHLDPRGKIQSREVLERQPGCRVREVLENGDWFVEARDEDDEKTMKIWPAGNPADERDAAPGEDGGMTDRSPAPVGLWGNGWRLDLPRGEVLVQGFTLEGGNRVLAVTESYRIYEWRLDEIEGALENLGL